MNQYHRPLIVIVKEAVKAPLKSCALGKLLYPLFQKVYKVYAVPKKRRCLQKNGQAVLERLECVMRKHGILHCMEFGTLLGIVRDRGFIKHDDDVDVTILPNCIEPVVLLKKFLDEGYGFVHGFEYQGRLIEFTIADQTHVTIDVFMPQFNQKDPNYFDFTIPFWEADRQYPNERANNVRLTTYLASKEIRDVDFMGVTVPIAGNAEDVLTSEYGCWKTPDPNYRPEDRIKIVVLEGYAFRVTKEQALAL